MVDDYRVSVDIIMYFVVSCSPLLHKKSKRNHQINEESYTKGGLKNKNNVDKNIRSSRSLFSPRKPAGDNDSRRVQARQVVVSSKIPSSIATSERSAPSPASASMACHNTTALPYYYYTENKHRGRNMEHSSAVRRSASFSETNRRRQNQCYNTLSPGEEQQTSAASTLSRSIYEAMKKNMIANSQRVRQTNLSSMQSYLSECDKKAHSPPGEGHTGVAQSRIFQGTQYADDISPHRHHGKHKTSPMKRSSSFTVGIDKSHGMTKLLGRGANCNYVVYVSNDKVNEDVEKPAEKGPAPHEMTWPRRSSLQRRRSCEGRLPDKKHVRFTDMDVESGDMTWPRKHLSRRGSMPAFRFHENSDETADVITEVDSDGETPPVGPNRVVINLGSPPGNSSSSEEDVTISQGSGDTGNTSRSLPNIDSQAQVKKREWRAKPVSWSKRRCSVPEFRSHSMFTGLPGEKTLSMATPHEDDGGSQGCYRGAALATPAAGEPVATATEISMGVAEGPAGRLRARELPAAPPPCQGYGTVPRTSASTQKASMQRSNSFCLLQQAAEGGHPTFRSEHHQQTEQQPRNKGASYEDILQKYMLSPPSQRRIVAPEDIAQPVVNGTDSEAHISSKYQDLLNEQLSRSRVQRAGMLRSRHSIDVTDPGPQATKDGPQHTHRQLPATPSTPKVTRVAEAQVRVPSKAFMQVCNDEPETVTMLSSAQPLTIQYPSSVETAVVNYGAQRTRPENFPSSPPDESFVACASVSSKPFVPPIRNRSNSLTNTKPIHQMEALVQPTRSLPRRESLPLSMLSRRNSYHACKLDDDSEDHGPTQPRWDYDYRNSIYSSASSVPNKWRASQLAARRLSSEYGVVRSEVSSGYFTGDTDGSDKQHSSNSATSSNNTDSQYHSRESLQASRNNSLDRLNALLGDDLDNSIDAGEIECLELSQDLQWQYPSHSVYNEDSTNYFVNALNSQTGYMHINDLNQEPSVKVSSHSQPDFNKAHRHSWNLDADFEVPLPEYKPHRRASCPTQALVSPNKSPLISQLRSAMTVHVEEEAGLATSRQFLAVNDVPPSNRKPSLSPAPKSPLRGQWSPSRGQKSPSRGQYSPSRGPRSPSRYAALRRESAPGLQDATYTIHPPNQPQSQTFTAVTSPQREEGHGLLEPVKSPRQTSHCSPGRHRAEAVIVDIGQPESVSRSDSLGSSQRVTRSSSGDLAGSSASLQSPGSVSSSSERTDSKPPSSAADNKYVVSQVIKLTPKLGRKVMSSTAPIKSTKVSTTSHSSGSTALPKSSAIDYKRQALYAENLALALAKSNKFRDGDQTPSDSAASKTSVSSTQPPMVIEAQLATSEEQQPYKASYGIVLCGAAKPKADDTSQDNTTPQAQTKMKFASSARTSAEGGDPSLSNRTSAEGRNPSLSNRTSSDGLDISLSPTENKDFPFNYNLKQSNKYPSQHSLYDNVGDGSQTDRRSGSFRQTDSKNYSSDYENVDVKPSPLTRRKLGQRRGARERHSIAVPSEASQLDSQSLGDPSLLHRVGSFTTITMDDQEPVKETRHQQTESHPFSSSGSHSNDSGHYGQSSSSGNGVYKVGYYMDTNQNTQTNTAKDNDKSTGLVKIATYVDSDDERNNMNIMQMKPAADKRKDIMPGALTVDNVSDESPEQCRDCSTQSVFSYDWSDQKVKKYHYCPVHNQRVQVRNIKYFWLDILVMVPYPAWSLNSTHLP